MAVLLWYNKASKQWFYIILILYTGGDKDKVWTQFLRRENNKGRNTVFLVIVINFIVRKFLSSLVKVNENKKLSNSLLECQQLHPNTFVV